MNKLLVIGLLLIALVGCTSTTHDALANCLTSKGVSMYGAFWCPHCAKQKESFSDSFSKINYIECSLPDKSDQTQICKDAKIESYPTWEFGDGSRLVGEQSLETLAAKAGCTA